MHIKSTNILRNLRGFYLKSQVFFFFFCLVELFGSPRLRFLFLKKIFFFMNIHELFISGVILHECFKSRRKYFVWPFLFYHLKNLSTHLNIFISSNINIFIISGILRSSLSTCFWQKSKIYFPLLLKL